MYIDVGFLTMPIISEYGLDSPARTLLILVLSIKDKQEQKAMNRLHFQKAIRFFEYLRKEKEIDFSNYKYGGVSYELQENLETLEECGLVVKSGAKYMLTQEGERAAQELLRKYDTETIRKLTFAKTLVNDLTDKELLFFMYMLLPETRMNSVEFDKLYVEREALVRRLFLKGAINAATAAAWLEIHQKKFLDSLPASE